MEKEQQRLAVYKIGFRFALKIKTVKVMQNEEKKFIEELSKRIQDYNNPDQAILAANFSPTP